MSLRAPLFSLIPEETARVARAAFPNGHIYLQMRDELGSIYTNNQFAALFPHDGQPAQSPAQLALITIMQFAEGLSDRQAADAVRDRLAWKYALGLELTDPGFDASVLCEFRARLIAGKAEYLLFDVMLPLLRERGLLKGHKRQRTDSTHVLAAIRSLNRLTCVGETLRYTLNELAAVAPIGCARRSRPTGLIATASVWRNFGCPKTRPSARPSPRRLAPMVRTC